MLIAIIFWPPNYFHYPWPFLTKSLKKFADKIINTGLSTILYITKDLAWGWNHDRSNLSVWSEGIVLLIDTTITNDFSDLPADLFKWTSTAIASMSYCAVCLWSDVKMQNVICLLNLCMLCMLKLLVRESATSCKRCWIFPYNLTGLLLQHYLCKGFLSDVIHFALKAKRSMNDDIADI